MHHRRPLESVRRCLGAELIEIEQAVSKIGRSITRLRAGFEELSDTMFELLPGTDLDDEVA
jgi:hypothetical protein